MTKSELIGLLMQKNNSLSLKHIEEAVKAANRSSDRVLWIRAKTQSGLNRSYTVELGDAKTSIKKKK